ncbi:hypothetical protein, partial [Streptomyces sp. NPDC057250]|uniref:hypothetical protein n=1 Tax=Streptomyces sp. NPDC057250 TaxID=3346068 RepID=UPI003640296E
SVRVGPRPAPAGAPGHPDTRQDPRGHEPADSGVLEDRPHPGPLGDPPDSGTPWGTTRAQGP